MIVLESSEWSKLTHAYGEASDIPSLITQLKNYPDGSSWKSEPYFSLWSALCHQGDIYTASFAAVPHLLKSCKMNPRKAYWSLAQLITCIEIARLQGRAPLMLTNLKDSYFQSISELPSVCEEMEAANSNDNILQIALAAKSVANGDGNRAEELLN